MIYVLIRRNLLITQRDFTFLLWVLIVLYSFDIDKERTQILGAECIILLVHIFLTNDCKTWHKTNPNSVLQGIFSSYVSCSKSCHYKLLYSLCIAVIITVASKHMNVLNLWLHIYRWPSFLWNPTYPRCLSCQCISTVQMRSSQLFPCCLCRMFSTGTVTLNITCTYIKFTCD